MFILFFMHLYSPFTDSLRFLIFSYETPSGRILSGRILSGRFYSASLRESFHFVMPNAHSLFRVFPKLLELQIYRGEIVISRKVLKLQIE